MKPVIQAVFISLCIWSTIELKAQESPPIDSIFLLQKTKELIKYRTNDDYKAIWEWKLSMEEVLKDYCCKETIPFISNMEWLAIINQEYGYYDAAREAFKEAVRYAKEVDGSNSIEYALTLMRLANLYLEMGLYEESEAFFLEIKTILSQDRYKNNTLIGSFYTNLANLYSEMGRNEEALVYYQTSVEFHKKQYGENYIYLGYTYENMAILYWDLSKHKVAEDYYKKALAVYAKEYGKEDLEYAITLNNIGALYTDTKRYDEAKKKLLQALAIIRQHLGKDNIDYIITLRNLGDLYIFMNQHEDAKEVYEEALTISKEVLSKTEPDYFISFNSMHNYFSKTGDYETAEDYLLESMGANAGLSDPKEFNIEILSEYRFFSYPELISTAKDLLELWKTKTVEKNIDSKLLLKAIAFTDDILTLHKKQSNRFLVAANQLADLTENREIAAYGYWFLNALKKTDAKQANTLLDIKWTEYNKTSLLNNATQLDKAQSEGLLPEEWLEEEQELKEEIQAVELAILEDNSNEELREQWNQLSLDRSRLELKIKKAYPKYYSLKYKENTVDASLVQEKLDAQSAMLSYFTTKNYTYIFYLSQDKVHTTQQAIPNDSLALLTKNFRNSLTNYNQIKNNPETIYTQYTNYGYKLYKLLIAPTENYLKEEEIKHLVIIPDGELGYIPFEALLTQSVKQNKSYAELPYLMLDYEVSYNYSATLFNENLKRKNTQTNKELLAISANYERIPTLNHSPAIQQLRTVLQPLPAAEEEVKTLSNVFVGTFLFDSLATERKFKEAASQYAVIHLAMHGLLNQQDPILSSLAFTDIGDSTEDNFLQAYEIAKLDLKAQLVVLSACETAYGKFAQGEGVLSLARSFMYAGVPSLLVSLWQVNDVSTKIIMQNYYEALADGKPKTTALRLAKLNYLERAEHLTAHPAFWAAFIQIGNHQPINIEKKRDQWVWWLLAGGILFTLAGLLFFIQQTKRQNKINSIT